MNSNSASGGIVSADSNVEGNSHKHAASRLEKDFQEFFEKHKIHGNHHVKSATRHHLFGHSIFRWPRRIVFYDDSLDGFMTYHSRAHRKNRYMEFNPKEAKEGVSQAPRMPTLLSFDWKNISWHVAVYFCLGSICWIVNGQYALMQDDSTYVVNAIGYSGFAGGMLFWLGAYLAVVEALNPNENLYYGTVLLNLAKEKGLHHYHAHRLKHMKESLREQRLAEPEVVAEVVEFVSPQGDEVMTPSHPKWRWVGYSPTIGFWAAFLQFIGATFFAIAVICGIPGVIGPTQWQLQQTFIWTMQTVGSVFFVVSSWMMMVEEQINWYMPACGRIGWQSAFWNVLGSIGFLLSAVFGYLANWEGNGVVCCQLWGTAFNTYWGSWGFMIASAFLYYEVENKQQQSFADTMSVMKSWFAYTFGQCQQPSAVNDDGERDTDTPTEENKNISTADTV